MKKIFIILVSILVLGGLYMIVTNKKTTQPQTVIQSHRTYSLKLTSSISNIQPNKQTTIIYTIVDENGNVLKDYQFDHTKLMHFIVVRADLQDFQHLHPDFNKDTGEFTVPITFTTNGRYRLFADFTPGQGQKDSFGNYLTVTASYDVSVGNLPKYVSQDVVPDMQTTKIVGEYQIDYFLPQQITTSKEIALTLHVTKNGQPVTDMEEYLGAQAHGILLQKNTLEFAHLHAMGISSKDSGQGTNMQNMNTRNTKMTTTGPDITFNYTFPSSGIYKLFTQFQVKGKVITTDYIIQVK